MRGFVDPVAGRWIDDPVAMRRWRWTATEFREKISDD